jgi:hypothetical protein
LKKRHPENTQGALDDVPFPICSPGNNVRKQPSFGDELVEFF